MHSSSWSSGAPSRISYWDGHPVPAVPGRRPAGHGPPQTTADQVDAHVFLGGYLAAADAAWLRRAGISRVVKLCADDPTVPGGDARVPGVQYLVLPVRDDPSEDITAAATQAVIAIKAARRAGERVLVHCHAGVSRSATVVLLYLMLVRGFTLDEAYGYLEGVRPVINPNAGFRAALRATDERWRALHVGDERWPASPWPISLGEAVARGVVHRDAPPRL